MDMRKYDCVFCIHDRECDLEDRKDHAYNLRDGTHDCFVPHNRPVSPWRDPFHECYGCFEHECKKCNKYNNKNKALEEENTNAQIYEAEDAWERRVSSYGYY